VSDQGRTITAILLALVNSAINPAKQNVLVVDVFESCCTYRHSQGTVVSATDTTGYQNSVRQRSAKTRVVS